MTANFNDPTAVFAGNHGVRFLRPGRPGGLLEYQGNRARLLLEHQSEGYFNNEMFINQVIRSIAIFENKYPIAQGPFIFDNALSHMKPISMSKQLTTLEYKLLF